MSATSIIQQIVTAAVAALNVASLPAGLTKPDPLTIDLQRLLPIDKGPLPIMVVYPDVEAQTGRVGTQSSPVSARAFKFKVDCWISVVVGQPIYTALEPLRVWAISALMLDQTLGGLGYDLQHTDSEYDARLANRVFATVTLGFVIYYPVLAADPTTRG